MVLPDAFVMVKVLGQSQDHLGRIHGTSMEQRFYFGRTCYTGNDVNRSMDATQQHQAISPFWHCKEFCC